MIRQIVTLVVRQRIRYGDYRFLWTSNINHKPVKFILLRPVMLIYGWAHQTMIPAILIEVPVPSQESERSCISLLFVSMFVSFYDLSIGFWKYCLRFIFVFISHRHYAKGFYDLSIGFWSCIQCAIFCFSFYYSTIRYF